MNLEEYKQKLAELEAEFKSNKDRLSHSYVLANNPYKIGDIVTDRIGSIIIEDIRWSYGMFEQPPCAVYYGIELNKNKTPNKRGNKRQVWQSNLIKT